MLAGAACIKAQAKADGHAIVISWVFDATEVFLDAGDVVHHRRLADRIYRDLTDERISFQRAAVELRELVRQQKGSWLERRVQGWLAALRDNHRLS